MAITARIIIELDDRRRVTVRGPTHEPGECACLMLDAIRGVLGSHPDYASVAPKVLEWGQAIRAAEAKRPPRGGLWLPPGCEVATENNAR